MATIFYYRVEKCIVNITENLCNRRHIPGFFPLNLHSFTVFKTLAAARKGAKSRLIQPQMPDHAGEQ